MTIKKTEIYKLTDAERKQQTIINRALPQTA